MAAIDQTVFRTDVQKARVLPPGDLLVTQSTVEQLKIPDDVALRPENVIPFLRNQSVKYLDLVEKSEIKALSADIQEYIHDEGAFLQAPSLTPEEREALSSWSNGNTVRIQSEGDLRDLEEMIDNLIREDRRLHPERYNNLDPAFEDVDQGDLFTTTPMLMRGFQENEEERRETEKAIMAAASSGNAELLIAVMAETHAKRVMKVMATLVKRQADLIDAREKVFKELNPDANPSAAELAKFNADFARFQGDVSNNMLQIQFAMNEYTRKYEQAPTLMAPARKPLEMMIQNIVTR